MWPHVYAVCVRVIHNVFYADGCLLVCYPCLRMLGELAWHSAHTLTVCQWGDGYAYGPLLFIYHMTPGESAV